MICGASRLVTTHVVASALDVNDLAVGKAPDDFAVLRALRLVGIRLQEEDGAGNPAVVLREIAALAEGEAVERRVGEGELRLGISPIAQSSAIELLTPGRFHDLAHRALEARNRFLVEVCRGEEFDGVPLLGRRSTVVRPVKQRAVGPRRGDVFLRRINGRPEGAGISPRGSSKAGRESNR